MIDAYIKAVIDAYATVVTLQPATSTCVEKSATQRFYLSITSVLSFRWFCVCDSLHLAACLVYERGIYP